MIKAYVAGIPTLYEGEDIEIRYAIYEDQNLLAKEYIKMRYKKPSVVGAVALQRLLKALGKYTDQEILIVVNEAALCEFIRGTGKTKNVDLQKLVREIQKELLNFDNVTIKDVGVDFKELEKWNEELQGH